MTNQTSFLKDKIGLTTGIILAIISYLISFNLTSNSDISITIAVAFLMFSWWISEALPAAITALIPISVFPVFEIISINEVTSYYGNKIIFLMLSGFLLGLVLTKWNLNYRIALNILKYTKKSPGGIILGFMIATAFLSMWVSNTSSTLIMLPIALSFLKVLEDKIDTKFALILMISIAYSASIGGISTIIGTPTNAILVSFLEEIHNIEFSFLRWFLSFTPLALTLLILIWLYIKIFQLRNIEFKDSIGTNFINKKLEEIGKIKYEEKIIMCIFILLALSWTFRGYLPFEISDSAIGLIFTSLFFLFSSKNGKEKLLTWEDTKNLSWGTLILFGGGITLAKSLEKTGVINFVSDMFIALEIKNYLLAIIFVSFIAIFLTEFMSNLALITILAPILMTLSLSLGGSVELLSIPATIAASCAFMLPMATPPNAIILSSGYVSVKQMIKVGLIANLIAIMTVALYTHFIL